MELVVSCKNHEEFNKIRKYLAEDYLETEVEFNSYKIIGTDSQKISIEQGLGHYNKRSMD